jgi:hypothetical protein
MHASSDYRATSPHYRTIIARLSGISYRYRFLLLKDIAFEPPLLRALPGNDIELSHARLENRQAKLHVPLAMSPCLPPMIEAIHSETRHFHVV